MSNKSGKASGNNGGSGNSTNTWDHDNFDLIPFPHSLFLEDSGFYVCLAVLIGISALTTSLFVVAQIIVRRL